MRIHHIMLQQRSGFVKAHDLATCTETGVDAHYTLFSQRRCEKELAEIVAEQLHRSYIRPLFGILEHFGRQGRKQQSPVSVFHCVSEHRGQSL